jgi:hypothetical protein
LLARFGVVILEPKVLPLQIRVVRGWIDVARGGSDGRRTVETRSLVSRS